MKLNEVRKTHKKKLAIISFRCSLFVVRFDSSGSDPLKNRYYFRKLGADFDDGNLEQMKRSYLEGLNWVRETKNKTKMRSRSVTSFCFVFLGAFSRSVFPSCVCLERVLAITLCFPSQGD
jgi:hypothetical protein